MKKSVLIIMVIVFCISISAYPFPNIDNYNFYGSITYTRNNFRLGYIINRYNELKQKIRQEVYDSEGKLIKYTTYNYDSNKLLIKLSEYNANRTLIKEVTFENKDSGPIKKTIKYQNKLSTNVDFEYAYYKNKLLYIIERYYYIDPKSGVTHDTIFKKTLYTYKGKYEKLVEQFRKDIFAENKEYQLQSAEIYRYNSEDKIIGILRLDSNRNPLKYHEYVYGNDGKIWKINIYRVKSSYYKWRGDFGNLSKTKFYLNNFIVYEYDQDKFKSVSMLDSSGSTESVKTAKDKDDDDIRPKDAKKILETIYIEPADKSKTGDTKTDSKTKVEVVEKPKDTVKPDDKTKDAVKTDEQAKDAVKTDEQAKNAVKTDEKTKDVAPVKGDSKIDEKGKAENKDEWDDDDDDDDDDDFESEKNPKTEKP
ncbi:MAG: hypothetical protein OEV44_03495 [Spirochaetota bacterium]|nr:hypothetical protein [Spirochaetota bacterium]